MLSGNVPSHSDDVGIDAERIEVRIFKEFPRFRLDGRREDDSSDTRRHLVFDGFEVRAVNGETAALSGNARVLERCVNCNWKHSLERFSMPVQRLVLEVGVVRDSLDFIDPTLAVRRTGSMT